MRENCLYGGNGGLSAGDRWLLFSNQAKEPHIAARILVQGMKEGTFTGRKLSDSINDHSTNFNKARNVVNGTDKAGTIAAIAQRLQSAL